MVDSASTGTGTECRNCAPCPATITFPASLVGTLSLLRPHRGPPLHQCMPHPPNSTSPHHPPGYSSSCMCCPTGSRTLRFSTWRLMTSSTPPCPWTPHWTMASPAGWTRTLALMRVMITARQQIASRPPPATARVSRTDGADPHACACMAGRSH